MAVVYTVIAAFENTFRDLVTRVLLEAHGEEWWQTCVSEKVRKRAETRREDEQKHRFHKQRGEAPINYTEFGDLANLIWANWEDFEAFFPSPEWVTSIVEAVERSRNVIMHSGTLDAEDVARIGIHLRDWIKRVGAVTRIPGPRSSQSASDPGTSVGWRPQKPYGVGKPHNRAYLNLNRPPRVRRRRRG